MSMSSKHTGGNTPFCRVKNFFLEHYDHPIYEGGVLLADMVYLRRELSC